MRARPVERTSHNLSIELGQTGLTVVVEHQDGVDHLGGLALVCLLEYGRVAKGLKERKIICGGLSAPSEPAQEEYLQ